VHTGLEGFDAGRLQQPVVGGVGVVGVGGVGVGVGMGVDVGTGVGLGVVRMTGMASGAGVETGVGSVGVSSVMAWQPTKAVARPATSSSDQRLRLIRTSPTVELT